jgi:hypothetical protein
MIITSSASFRCRTSNTNNYKTKNDIQFQNDKLFIKRRSSSSSMMMMKKNDSQFLLQTPPSNNNNNSTRMHNIRMFINDGLLSNNKIQNHSLVL